jgi:hypothetical protein
MKPRDDDFFPKVPWWLKIKRWFFPKKWWK